MTNDKAFKKWLANANAIEIAIVRAKLVDIAEMVADESTQQQLRESMEKQGNMVSPDLVISTWENVNKYLGFKEQN